jgi:AcrR family transcriptional regulator
VIAEGTGRANQKLRTRTAIIEAARTLVRTGAPLTMPEVARAALVSEVTAYRYFPDLQSLLGEIMGGLWPTPAEALEPVAASRDPVERVTRVCEVLLRGIVAYQGAVRSVIAATIGRPELARTRPDLRFALIELALDPERLAPSAPDSERLARLRRELAVLISAENLFCLTDRLGLDADDAIAHLTRMAATLTRAALGGGGPDPAGDGH